MTTLRHFSFLLLLFFCNFAIAQSATGAPPFSTTSPGFDNVNLANLNAHFDIPIVRKAGRGLPFGYILSYDTTMWTQAIVGGSTVWQPAENWGWRGSTESAVGYVNYAAQVLLCPDGITHYNQYTFEYYSDPSGTQHPIDEVIVDNTCNGGATSQSAVSADGSGYTVAVTSTPSARVYSRDGGSIEPPLLTGVGEAIEMDNNGNEITTTDGSAFTDTLGVTALSISGAPPNPVSLTYPGPSGTNVSVVATFSPYTVQTNFGCGGIGEYGPNSVSLLSSIAMPDGTSYNFSYEPTPGFPGNVTGRLQSISLPTGATISYTYTGGSNGITCADGTTAGLTRVMPDGTWTYSRSGSVPAWQTTMVDPKGNQTVLNFQGIYETQRLVYQGTSTLLETVQTCYNGSAVPCTSTPVSMPITERAVVTQLPNSSGTVSESDYFFNMYGLTTEEDDYDYGSGSRGSLLRKVLTTYASLGNNIVDHPSQVTIENAGGSVLSQTTYAYDETGVTATSGTPQHVSISGSRGNPTTVTNLVQGTSTLHRTYTYFDTGLVKTQTDTKGNSTSNTYGACGNSFLTNVSYPLSLSKSALNKNL